MLRACGTSALAAGRGVRIHCIDVEIFVAALVLCIQHEAGVPAPEVCPDWPLRLVGHGLGRREWLGTFFTQIFRVPLSALGKKYTCHREKPALR